MKKLKSFLKNIAGLALKETLFKRLDHENVISVVGRGHSGTRAISLTLQKSGIFMGSELNISGDLVPAKFLYKAALLSGNYASYKGNFEWDFSRLNKGLVNGEAVYRLRQYLQSIFVSTAKYRGWKLPETTFIFPWLVKVLPEIKYIFWVRDPRDSVLNAHKKTDDLRDWNIPCEKFGDILTMRAASWKYQWDIVKATPKPKHFITVRFEDFVLDQSKTLKRLEDFLGISLAKVQVDKNRVGMWKKNAAHRDFYFLKPAMSELGYI